MKVEEIENKIIHSVEENIELILNKSGLGNYYESSLRKGRGINEITIDQIINNEYSINKVIEDLTNSEIQYILDGCILNLTEEEIKEFEKNI